MARAVVAVLDSLGVGAAGDASRFGDTGADTLGHIADACASGRADSAARSGPLAIPNLAALGLIDVAASARGAPLPVAVPAKRTGLYGYAAELSSGKDTPSGHWELMGLPVEFEWGYFRHSEPALPPKLTAALIAQGGIEGILGNRHASGTAIIDDLGAEHLASLKPIVYTSADSVLQIAAHEEAFGLERLYALCAVARKLVDPYRIARVIARPFLGDKPGSFHRTGNRKDLATPPHGPTLLDRLMAEGGEIVAIGKVGDIFAHRGISRVIKAHGNGEVMERLLEVLGQAPDRSIVFANFNDFDTLFGHRRDVAGYAAALEAFDRALPRLQSALRPGDMAVIAADHGCDPTWPGSDHTREYVPVLAFGPGIEAGTIGRRNSFADVGQSLAQHLGLPRMAAGTSFLQGERL